MQSVQLSDIPGGLILTAIWTCCELLTSEFSISKTREIARDRWFFFFPETKERERERETHNDVNVTVAISLRVSLREFERV